MGPNDSDSGLYRFPQSSAKLSFKYRGVRICVLVAALVAIAMASPFRGEARTLTMDDQLNLSRIDRATLSPDGAWIAVVVQRPPRPGEVFGRGYFELDPSRGDVWLISRRTGERRNLTQGAQAAAGFWCATWSPDGERLAMLSTAPQGDEPRGGDNVRLYVWNRTTNALTRMSDAPMRTQTTGGSPMYRSDLRGGADGGTTAHRCSDEENAPFLWLDNRRLLAVTLPTDAVSGLIDASSRPLRQPGETLRALREGVRPTVSAAGSGAARVERGERADVALLRLIDVDGGVSTMLASVPTYPFRGELSVSIAPDARHIAVLTTVGAIPPSRRHANAHQDDSWSVERRLGFVNVGTGEAIRWAAAPPEARYPLDLFGWSPDGRRIALRARGDAETMATPLFVASVDDLSIVRLGADLPSVGGPEVGSYHAAHASTMSVVWVDNQRLLANAPNASANAPPAQGTGRTDWWLIAPGAESMNLAVPASGISGELLRANDGRFFMLSQNRLMLLDIARHRFDPVPSTTLPEDGSIVWPRGGGRETSELFIATSLPTGDQRIQRISLREASEAPRPFVLPRTAELLDLDPAHAVALWRDPTSRGLYLRETSLASGSRRDLLSLNDHLGTVDWGQTRLIDYRGGDGQSLNAAVILPPDYRPGRRYPTIVWIYPGYRVRDLNGYFLDPNLPGFYNLQLYASRGYVVLIPSMPMAAREARNDFYLDLSKGVLPAVDRLIELGIADPDRLGLLGQSFGGYGVYGLITQTTRFRAAVALAGFADLVSMYTQFDATARGYPGIEHERSYNWSMLEAGPVRIGVPPYEDYSRYWRNSPLAFVDRVETPLLLIHGEQDVRAPMSQAESFFYSLYRQGKTARILRYWGENHGLSQSPANVRDIFEEIVLWFDTYLSADPAQARAPAASPSSRPRN